MASIATFVILAILIIIGLLSGSHLPSRFDHADPKRTDNALYTAISDRMVRGENYYEAVNHEQPVRGYPTRPFVTVREPTLAYATKLFGGVDRIAIVLIGLGIAAVLAMMFRLEKLAPNRVSWWASTVILAFATFPYLLKNVVVLHEAWSGLLITAALLLFGASRWWISVVIALLAVLIRELAMPFLAVMAVIELCVGNLLKAVAWVVSIGIFAVFLAIHATQVIDQTTASTAESRGWLFFGGWPFFVDCVRHSSILTAMPIWVAAVVTPLAILGWLSRGDAFSRRVTMVLLAYAVAFSCVGRPENTYWGFEFVFLLLPGLAFAPSAIADLVQRVGRDGAAQAAH